MINQQLTHTAIYLQREKGQSLHGKKSGLFRQAVAEAGKLKDEQFWRVKYIPISCGTSVSSAASCIKQDTCRLYSTAYIILCFVQENGHKKVSNEHNSRNRPPARALATEYNHQVCSPLCCKSASRSHQYANNNTSYAATPMRHISGPPNCTSDFLTSAGPL